MDMYNECLLVVIFFKEMIKVFIDKRTSIYFVVFL